MKSVALSAKASVELPASLNVLAALVDHVVAGAIDEAGPLVPAGRHVGTGVAVEVLPKILGPVARAVEPGGYGGLVPPELPEPRFAEIGTAAGDAVVMRVLPSEEA